MPGARTAFRGVSRPARLVIAAVLLAAFLWLTPGDHLPGGVAPTAIAQAAGLAEARSELEQAQAALRAKQAELDQLAQEFADAENRLEQTRDEVAQAKSSVEESRADLGTVQDRLASRLRSIYMNGGSRDLGLLGLLFQRDMDLNDLINQVRGLSDVAEQDQELFQQVSEHLDRLEVAKADLEEREVQEQAHLDDLGASKAHALDVLEASKDEYNGLKQRVAELEEEQRRAEAARQAAAKAETARQAAAASSPSRGGERSSGGSAGPTGVIASGSWVFPVQGPNSFIDSWGYARSGGRSHQGTDIMSPRNTPLVAVTNGVISKARASESGLGGITLWLRGDDGNSYYYAHLESIAGGISSGTRVQAGQVIGYVGNTGNARGGETHLHFEIRPGGGSPVNPYPTLIKYR